MATTCSEEDAANVRGADWRLLLPAAAPRSAICIRSAELAKSLVSVGVDVVSSDRGGPVDLVVASEPSVEELRGAVGSLRPGGGVYVESRPLPRARARLLRLLHDAELERPSIYWPLRRHAATSAWIPMLEGGPADYFLETRESIRIGAVGVPAPIARAGFSFARRLDMLAPLVAVARKPAPTASTSDAGILARLEARWRELTRDGADARLEWLLVAPGSSSISKLVAFVFADGGAVPRLVVKSGRTAAANEALEREAENLASLAALPAARRESAPVCLDVERRADGTVAVVESFVGGIPLYRSLTPATFDRIARSAVDWLVGLVDVDAPRRSLQTALVLLADETSDLAEPVRHAAAAASSHVPPAFEQRDFSPWNVLVDGESIGVVDWESSDPRGLPALDLVYFLANCGFMLDKATTVADCVRSYRQTIGRDCAAEGVFSRCIERYTAAIGLDDGAVRPLRVATWSTHLGISRRLPVPASRDDILPTGAELFGALLREELS